MISWKNYVKKLISIPDEMDSITLSFDEGNSNIPIPAIVKASILMLDKMVQNKGKRHVIVFPEREYTSLTFAVIRAIHNISTGKIEKEYNIEDFVPGDRLKLGNAVAEFLGLAVINGIDYMQIKLSDTNRYSIPVASLPIFQKTDTKRPLSSSAKFKIERDALNLREKASDNSTSYLNELKQFKSHMSASVYYVSAVNGVREQLAEMRFCGEKLSKYLLLGKSNYEGRISNIGSGQLTGIPAIVFSSDIYAVNASIDYGNPAQSVIIDISNMNLILSQLDALDQVIDRGIPIIFVTDTCNSLDFSALRDRSFNVWRWDKNTIVNEFYANKESGPETVIKHCVQQELKFLKVAGNEISDSARILAKYRWKIREQSVQMMDLYGKLNNISFKVLRETVPFDTFELKTENRELDTCMHLLEMEKAFMSQAEYEDYYRIICNYRRVYSNGYQLNKENALKNTLDSYKGKRICLVIQEHGDKTKIESYWRQRLKENTQMDVLFPSEYYSASATKYDLTIIIGWLKRAIMRKLIFSYHTASYTILLYDYENRWRSHDSRQWRNALSQSDNKIIIDKAFNSSDLKVSYVRYRDEILEDVAEEVIEDDELEEIDNVLRENKFKRYVKSGVKSGNQVIEAVPVNFVGGYISFYQTGHHVVSATKLINRKSEKIESLTPGQLHNGDFVVVRESDKDIVREMADIILANSGQSNLRELATKWKEVIEIELLFTTPDKFYESLMSAGFQKGFATVKRWIEDDNVIAPRQKEDLAYIAKVTQNQVLSEKIDEIFDAATVVRAAHIQAGKTLSEKLKDQIAEVLKRFGKIDPLNIWEPIDINVEGFGLVRILKIIDIGVPVQVDASDTNRLIEE